MSKNAWLLNSISSCFRDIGL